MAGYYRSFCKNFSAVVAPLTDLLSPKVCFHWSSDCECAFYCVKALLTNAPILAAPVFDRAFRLFVDASDAGVGAVLLQEGDGEVEHPVSYLALKHFEVYVGSADVPTVIYTDHNPLVFINPMRNTNQRLMRWSLFLQAFNVEVRHVRGGENVLADALSRCS